MAYLDGEFAPDQRHEFERHVKICPSCVNCSESYKATVRMGKAAMQEASLNDTGHGLGARGPYPRHPRRPG